MNKLTYLKENIEISERYELALDRIRQIAAEAELESPYKEFFAKEAEFLLSIMNLFEQIQYGDYENFTLRELEEKNRVLYGELRDPQALRPHAGPAGQGRGHHLCHPLSGAGL